MARTPRSSPAGGKTEQKKKSGGKKGIRQPQNLGDRSSMPRKEGGGGGLQGERFGCLAGNGVKWEPKRQRRKGVRNINYPSVSWDELRKSGRPKEKRGERGL